MGLKVVISIATLIVTLVTESHVPLHGVLSLAGFGVSRTSREAQRQEIESKPSRPEGPKPKRSYPKGPSSRIVYTLGY